MSEQNQTVKVTILDKEYQVSCAPDEVSALRQSAAHVDEKMREIKSNSNVLGLDRIAVMAALNIANDYLSQSQMTDELVNARSEDITALYGKVDRVLSRLKGSTN
ncbi:MAG: cell division protein ZapA [Pseudomonadales bacterium]